MRPGPPSRAQIAAALLVVYVLWGSTYLGMLLAIRTIPVFLMAASRFLIAGAVLYAWSSRRSGRHERPTLRQWLAAGVVGVLLFTVGNTGVAWAEKRVATGIASLIIASVPLWMALFDRIACGQRLGRNAVVGLALGFGGVSLLAWPSGGGVDLVGALVLVFAASAWAAGSLRARRAPLPGRPLVGSSMQMLAGGAILLVVSIAAGEPGRVHHVSATSLLALGYLVVFGSILAFSTYGWLLQNARTSLVSTYAYVNPLVAVFLGWAIENEAVTARTVGAGAIILAAVALIVTPPRVRERLMALPARGR